MESNKSSELPVITTHPVNRLKEALGLLPRSNDLIPIDELCVSHFPQTVQDFLNCFRESIGKIQLIWVTDNVFFMDNRYYSLARDFQPRERIPLSYLTVEFRDRFDDGWFCPSPPKAYYSPTERVLKASSGRIKFYALSADDAVSVLEKLAHLPDTHDFVWKIDPTIFYEPDLFLRVLECLPITVRRDFIFTSVSFTARLCPLVFAPRGSSIKLCFESVVLSNEDQVTFVQAVAEREDADDHRLWLKFGDVYFEKQNLIGLLNSKKVDTLELDFYDLTRLDSECIQALTRSQLRRFAVNCPVGPAGPHFWIQLGLVAYFAPCHQISSRYVFT